MKTKQINAKLIAIMLCVVLCLVGLAALATRGLATDGEKSATSAPTLYVDDDWAGKGKGDKVDEGITFGTNGFANIQDAIAAADVSNGIVTINVKTGVYTGTEERYQGDISFSKYEWPNEFPYPNLRYTEGEENWYGRLHFVADENVEVRGMFRVFDQCANTNWSDLTFEGFTFDGSANAIYIDNNGGKSKNITIKDNTFKYAGVGIYMGCGSVDGMTVTGNKFESTGTNTNICTIGAEINNVTISDNEFAGQLGIYGFIGNEGVTVSDNTCAKPINFNNSKAVNTGKLTLSGNTVADTNTHVLQFNRTYTKKSDIIIGAGNKYGEKEITGWAESPAGVEIKGIDTNNYNKACYYNGKLYLGDEPVAMIGETGYPTLKAAVAAVGIMEGKTATIKLVADVKDNISVAADENITLDLNGHALTPADVNSRVITNSGNFTLTDTAKTASHKFVADADGKWVRNDEGTYEVKSGYITGAVCAISNSGTFNMTGGAIVGNTPPTSQTTAAAIFSTGTVNISGGMVSGNTATNQLADIITNSNGILNVSGGEISYNNVVSVNEHSTILNMGTMTISGGKISNNTHLGKNPAQGGAIFMKGGNSVLTMTGGELSNNSALDGGAIYFYGKSGAPATFNFEGGEIKDNSAGQGVAVYYGGDTVLNMSGGKISGHNGSNGTIMTENGNAVFNLSGGEITGNRRGVVNYGVMKMTGGKIYNNIERAIHNGKTVEITDGQIYSNGTDLYGTATNYAISGGLFGTEVAQNSIIDGYMCVANTDEATKDNCPFTIGKNPASDMWVARVGNEWYATIEEALTVAQTAEAETTVYFKAYPDYTFTKGSDGELYSDSNRMVYLSKATDSTTNTNFFVYTGKGAEKTARTMQNIMLGSEKRLEVPGNTLKDGDIVLLPEGNIYDGSSIVDMYGDITLVGAGEDKTVIYPTTIYQQEKGGYRYMRLYNRYPANVTTGTDVYQYNFKNLTFDGDVQQGGNLNTFVVTCYNIEINAENVTFKNFPGSVFSIWANDTLTDGSYPTKANNVGVKVYLDNVTTQKTGRLVHYDCSPYTDRDLKAGFDRYAFIEVNYLNSCSFDDAATPTFDFNESTAYGQENCWLNSYSTSFKAENVITKTDVRPAAAKIGAIGYATVQEAFNAAKTGDTVKIVADFEDQVDVNDKAVKVEVAEGKTFVPVYNGNGVVSTDAKFNADNKLVAGTFSADPSAYIAPGYVVKKAGDNYVVEPKIVIPTEKGSIGVDIDTEIKQNGAVSDEIPSDQKEVAKTYADQFSSAQGANKIVNLSNDANKIADSLTMEAIESLAEAKGSQVKEALEQAVDAAKDAADQQKNVSIETKVTTDTQVVVNGLTKAEKQVGEQKVETLTIALDITPVYSVEVITTIDGVKGEPVKVVENAKLEIAETKEVVIPAPTGFEYKEGMRLYVDHTKDDGTAYTYNATYFEDESGGRFIQFTNLHGFSGFVFRSENPVPTGAVAEIHHASGETESFNTLQAAFDKAIDGETVYMLDNVQLQTADDAVIEKNIILNLGGKELTCSDKEGVLQIYGNVRIENGTIKNTYGKAGAVVVKLCMSGIVNVASNVNILLDAGGATRYAVKDENGLEGTARVNLADGHYVGTIQAGYITISGGEFDGNISTNTSLNISGGEFNYSISALKAGDCFITDGKFNSSVDVPDGKVSGGHFKTKLPQSKLEDTKCWSALGAEVDGYYSVVDAVAEYNGVRYASVAEAIEVAKTTGTVKILSANAAYEVDPALVAGGKTVKFDKNGFNDFVPTAPAGYSIVENPTNEYSLTLNAPSAGAISETYDGNAKTTTAGYADAAGTPAGVTYKWFTDAACTELKVEGATLSVTDACEETSYYVQAYTTGYASKAVEVKVKIDKAEYNMTDVKFEDVKTTYDGQNHSIIITGDLPTGTDGKQVTVSYSEGSTNVVTEKQITATFATESGNYNVPTAMTAKLTINKKDATITPNDASKIAGNADPELTATVTGAVTGETLAYTVTRAEGEPAGEYTISVIVDETAAVNKNYSIDASKTATFTITACAAKVKHDDVETYYTTLNDALDAAEDGDTVTLLADINPNTKTITIDKGITFDFGTAKIVGKTDYSATSNPQIKVNAVGKTVTFTGTTGGISAAGMNNRAITIQNGDLVIDGGEYISTNASLIVDDTGTKSLTVNGGTLKAVRDENSTTSNVRLVEDFAGNVTVNGGSIIFEVAKASQAKGIELDGEGYKVTIKSGADIKISNKNGMGYVVDADQNNNVEINGGKIDVEAGGQTRFINNANNVIITNVEYTVKGTLNTVVSSVENTTVTGGTYNIQPTYSSGEPTDIFGSTNTEVSGGTYTVPVKPEKCAEKFVPESHYDEEKQTWVYGVVESDDPVVAQIMDNDKVTHFYKSLAAAIEAAGDNGNTVKLLADITLSAAQDITKPVTIDLNGKTITGDNSGKRFVVKTGGDLTLKDSANTKGKLTASGDGSSCIVKVADGGKFVLDGAQIKDANYGVCAWGSGQIEIKTGTIETVLAAVSTNGNGGTQQVNISGGTLKSTTTSKVDDNVAVYLPSGTTTISGGKIEGPTGVYVKGGKVTVSGGTINGTGTAVPYVHGTGSCTATGDAFVVESSNYPAAPPTVEITGGTFNSTNKAAVASYSADAEHPAIGKFITGGIFSSDITDLCADGYVPQKIDDNKYVVSAGLLGSGTEEDPYQIRSVADLIYLRDVMLIENEQLGKIFSLEADLNLNNDNWTPIGSDEHPFGGCFYGNNHTISNLKIDSTASKVGLFGVFTNKWGNKESIKQEIKDLTLNNVDVKGDEYCGALVGETWGGQFNIFTNCHVTGLVKVEGTNFVGGLIGHGYTTINNCSVKAEDESYIKGTRNVGGITGWHGGEGNYLLTNCTVEDIVVTADTRVGGITGFADCYNVVTGCTVEDVTITGTEDGSGEIYGTTTGLIVGYNNGVSGLMTQIFNNEVKGTTSATAKEHDVDHLAGTAKLTIVGKDIICEKDTNGHIKAGTITSGDIEFIGTEDNANAEICKLLASDKALQPQANGTFKVQPAVASIGTKNYATLAEAVAAATDGQTITIISNIDLTGPIDVSKSIIIDLNGKTVTGDNNGKRFVVGNNGVLTLTDSASAKGKLTASGEGSSCIVKVADGGEFVLGGAEIKGANYGVCAWGSGKITINSGLIETERAAVSTNGNADQNQEVTIYGGTLTSTATEGSDNVAVYIPSGTATISGGTIEGPTGVYVKGGTVTVSDNAEIKGTGEVVAYSHGTGSCTATGDAIVLENSDYPAAPPTLSITGGTFTSTYGKAVASYGQNDSHKALGGFISGGKFSSMVPYEYCAEGFMPVKNSDGTYGVEYSTAVAVVTGEGKDPVYYTSFYDAYGASTTVDADTITLLADVQLVDSTVTTGVNQRGVVSYTKNVNLDGQGHMMKYVSTTHEGKTKSVPALFWMEAENGKISIKNTVFDAGRGTNGLTLDVFAAHVITDDTFKYNSEWTFENCTFQNCRRGIESLSPIKIYGCEFINCSSQAISYQQANVPPTSSWEIVNNKFTNCTSAAIDVGNDTNHPLVAKFNNNNVPAVNKTVLYFGTGAEFKENTFNGGEVKLFTNELSAETVFTSNTFNGSDVDGAKNTLTIKGQSAKSNDKFVVSTGEHSYRFVSEGSGVDLDISGATLGNSQQTKFKVEFKNGSSVTLPTNYAAFYNSNNLPDVYDIDLLTNAVAKNGNVYYTSINEAINDAKADSTVELLKDCEVSGNTMLVVNKSFTLDLNGKTLTGIGKTFEIINNAILTVDGTDTGSAATSVRFNVGKAGDDNGNLVLNGGTYTMGENTVVHVNGECTNSNVTIKGATITTGDNGVQLLGAGTYIIENSAITGETGVYVKAGELSVTGSTITGNGEAAEYSYSGNGANATGDAIVVDSCAYPGGVPEVTIGESNVIESTYGKQIGVYQKGEAGIPDITNIGGTALSLSDGYAWKDGKVVKAAASITTGANTVYYATLADAYAVAVSNGTGTQTTIKLLQNTTSWGLGEDTDKVNLVLDLNGKTLTFESPAVGSSAKYKTQALRFMSGSTAEIKNGTINLAAENKDKTWTSGSDDSVKGIAMLINNYGDLKLDGVSLDGSNIAHNGNNVRYVLSNNSGNVVLDNTTITAAEGDFAFDTCKSGTYAVPNVEVKGASAINGNVELSGGNLALNGGTLTGTLVDGGIGEGVITKATGFDATAPAGYAWDSTGKLVVAEAKIGTVYYATLAEAVKAAVDGTTVELLKDASSAGLFLSAGNKTITIDLQNHTYTATEPVGSSGTANQALHLEKGNTVTIKDGTLTTTSEEGKVQFRFVIQNYSNLTLDNVKVDGSNLAFEGKTNYAMSNNCGTVNITNGSEIKAPTDGIAFDTCKNGSYAVPTVRLQNAKITGNVELTGGNLVVPTNVGETANSTNMTGEFVEGKNYAPAQISIAGGSYSNPVKNEYCAAGFTPKDNGDGTYGVKYAGENVAEVYATDYPTSQHTTLSEAITTAEGLLAQGKQNIVIKMIADSNELAQSVLEIRNGITLDLNGYNVKARIAIVFGLIKDSGTTHGKLIVDQGSFAYMGGRDETVPSYAPKADKTDVSNESMLPVWNGTGSEKGYVFYPVNDFVRQWSPSSEKPKYQVRPESDSINQILVDGSGVQVLVEVRYSKDGSTYDKMTLEYGSSLIQSFLDQYSDNKAFSTTFSGTEGLTEIEAKTYLKSEKTGFSIVSDSIIKTINE